MVIMAYNFGEIFANAYGQAKSLKAKEEEAIANRNLEKQLNDARLAQAREALNQQLSQAKELSKADQDFKLKMDAENDLMQRDRWSFEDSRYATDKDAEAKRYQAEIAMRKKQYEDAAYNDAMGLKLKFAEMGINGEVVNGKFIPSQKQNETDYYSTGRVVEALGNTSAFGDPTSDKYSKTISALSKNISDIYNKYHQGSTFVMPTIMSGGVAGSPYVGKGTLNRKDSSGGYNKAIMGEFRNVIDPLMIEFNLLDKPKNEQERNSKALLLGHINNVLNAFPEIIKNSNLPDAEKERLDKPLTEFQARYLIGGGLTPLLNQNKNQNK